MPLYRINAYVLVEADSAPDARETLETLVNTSEPFDDGTEVMSVEVLSCEMERENWPA